MRKNRTVTVFFTLMAWSVGLLFFFPILWMFLTSFKTEIDAISTPPTLFFIPTVENYLAVDQRADYFGAAVNSIVVSGFSTFFALLMAIPAAYVFAFHPTSRTRGTMLWMLSTKMLPPVGVLIPIYLLYRDLGLLDTRTGLILIYTLINLPIIVWMLFSFFREIPNEILESGRIDGARQFDQITRLIIPLSYPGIFSCSLLSIILTWNESFWSINLTSAGAVLLPAFIASFSSPEGLFWAKLSAASTLAVLPILIFGWLTQRQLVRGLTFGAIK